MLNGEVYSPMPSASCLMVKESDQKIHQRCSSCKTTIRLTWFWKQSEVDWTKMRTLEPLPKPKHQSH